jgi:CspA family cold shock protein
MARITGTVKWFNDAKGFGFISQEGGPWRRPPSHSGERLQALAEGDQVEFEIVQGRRPQAADVAEGLTPFPHWKEASRRMRTLLSAVHLSPR